MRHFAQRLRAVLLAATTLAGCGDDDPIDIPSQPTPVAVTETFNGTLTVNGAADPQFAVDRAGTVTAQVKTLSDQAATLGVSLGTFNGAACQIIISNTAAASTPRSSAPPDHWTILRVAERCRQARRRCRLLNRRHALLILSPSIPDSLRPRLRTICGIGSCGVDLIISQALRTSSPPQI